MKTKKMKVSVYRILAIAVILLIVSSNAFCSPPQEFQKKISKEYQINPDAFLKLNSKYGQISCKNWEKNVISIEVTIEVEAPNQEVSQEIFDKINIDFNATKSVVEVKTDFNESVFDLISKKKNKLNVNYDVFYPETINLEVMHKFGSLFVEDVKGKVVLDLSYGSLQAGDINAINNELIIGYCKASIDDFGGGEVDVRYSTLSMDETKKSNINSKYSTLTINEANHLFIDSGYDHFKIGEVNSLNLKSQFSGINIEELLNSLEIDITYGNFDIDDVSSDFKEIIIKNTFANVKLGIDPDASYLINAELKYGGLELPENKANLEKQIISTSSSIYEGRIGNNANTTSKITINSKHAKVSLVN